MKKGLTFSFFLINSLTFTIISNAQVIYNDIPDTTLLYPFSTNFEVLHNYLRLDINNDGINDVEFIASFRRFAQPSCGPGGCTGKKLESYLLDPLSSTQISTINQSGSSVTYCTTPYNAGDTIMTNAHTWSSLGGFYRAWNDGPFFGCFVPYQSKFFAFQFSFSGQMHLGWIRAHQTSTSFTIMDYAYKLLGPGESLIAGEGMSGPSTVPSYNKASPSIYQNHYNLIIDSEETIYNVYVNSTISLSKQLPIGNKGTYNIDISNLSAGVYFVTLLTEKGRFTQKIFLSKE